MPAATDETPVSEIPVVILCGGMGTRLREVTESVPKPLVDIGGQPILWHIMKLFDHFGFRRFVLCLGYKSWDIKDNTLKGKDIRHGTLTPAHFEAGALPVTAYARVNAGTTAVTLDEQRSQNVASVTRDAAGVYCLELKPGVDRTVAVLAQAEGGNATQSAQWSGNCGVNGIQVKTEQQTIEANALVSKASDTVNFSVIVP